MKNKEDFKQECEETLLNIAIAFVEAGNNLGMSPEDSMNIVSKSIIDVGKSLNTTNKNMKDILNVIKGGEKK